MTMGVEIPVGIVKTPPGLEMTVCPSEFTDVTAPEGDPCSEVSEVVIPPGGSYVVVVETGSSGSSEVVVVPDGGTWTLEVSPSPSVSVEIGFVIVVTGLTMVVTKVVQSFDG